jgi:branched-chain amino acid transport system permease protein
MDWIQIIVYGILNGGYYSLMALGLTLLYGVGRIVNFAHGALIMLGVYMYYVFSILILNIHPFIAIVMSVVFMGIIGSIVHRLAIHPVLGDDAAVMVVTMTLGVLFNALTIMFFTAKSIDIINPIKSGSIELRLFDWVCSFSWELGNFKFLGVTVSWTQVITFFLSLLLFGLVTLFINMSKTGKALQAIAQDREAAMLMGINANKLYMLVMFMAAMLASIGGIMYSLPSASVNPSLWVSSIVVTFAIVILGGLGSIKGSLLASFIISFSGQIVYQTLPQAGAIVLVAPLAVMIAVLLVRPKGLFGKRVEMED